MVVQGSNETPKKLLAVSAGPGVSVPIRVVDSTVSTGEQAPRAIAAEIATSARRAGEEKQPADVVITPMPSLSHPCSDGCTGTRRRVGW
jgi:hypothetical protein